MALAFRILRLIALAIWVGAIVFFVAGVAGVAFANFDPHTAGGMVRGSLLALHRMGLAAGAIYFFFTLALLGTQRDTHPARAVELALIIAMMALTAYSQFSVIRHMEADRMALGGDVTTASADAPAKRDFERLHGLSTKLEGAVLIEGIILLGLACIHGRDEEYRF